MNYRHAYHAGNFADVLKHAALVAVLLHLRKKDTPFAVIDAHGGRGLYDLSSEEAGKTGEAQDGIGRVLAADTLPGVLLAHRDIVRSFGEGVCPGSPLIAAKLLRSRDRLVAIEKHPEEFAALKGALQGVARARVINGDFRRELKSLVPPPERRGVILIDPPYEAEGELAEAARAIIDAHRRFASGIYIMWYPAKDRAAVAAATGELLNAGINSLLQLELNVDGPVVAKTDRTGPPLSASGLLVVNPPFGFADEMKLVLPYLAQLLGRGPAAAFSLRQLAGEI
jgi:23S rRNA (adenine2030-N6)-methyltransferase